MRELGHLSIELEACLIVLLRSAKLLLLVFANIGDLDSAAERGEDRVLLGVDDSLKAESLFLDGFELARRLGDLRVEASDGLLEDLKLRGDAAESANRSGLRWSHG